MADQLSVRHIREEDFFFPATNARPLQLLNAPLASGTVALASGSCEEAEAEAESGAGRSVGANVARGRAGFRTLWRAFGLLPFDGVLLGVRNSWKEGRDLACEFRSRYGGMDQGGCE